jgi:putative hemolysin
MLTLEIAIVAVLIMCNGLLAMSELAIVSARRARLSAMAEAGIRGARSAAALAADPGRFLSTVQIGITMVGVLSGAFSGATLGARLAEWLGTLGMSPRTATTLGVAVVVALITYFSLIIGELVPKQIALKNAEGIAVRVAPFMDVLSKVAAPVVWLLDKSGKLVLKLMGQSQEAQSKVTDEEIAALIAEAESHGTIEAEERRMIAGVMRLGDRSVRAIMTPRTEVEWIDVLADAATVRRKLVDSEHSHLPAGEGSIDNIIGLIRTRDVLSAMLDNQAFEPRRHVAPAPVVHDHADALDVLDTLKGSEVPVALVHDEYGNFEGVVTPADILEAITGVFRFDALDGEPLAVQREDGSWLLAGSMPADEMADLLRLVLPKKRRYETVAGFVLAQISHLPKTGEWVEVMGWRFEVVDLDGRRIDKVMAQRLDA